MIAPMSYRLALALLVCIGLPSPAQDGKYAPLPDKIVTAKTVFLQNDTGEQKFADNVFKQLEQWGRWRVVTNRAGADIVLSLDHKDRFHNNFYLRVLDRESGETLWTAKRDIAIGGWGGVAKRYCRIFESGYLQGLIPSNTPQDFTLL
jgi:hypothetical protein